MRTWAFLLIIGFVYAARRNNLESNGYDSNNWPASLVIDTAHLSDSSAQHDLFYGGGGSASSTQRSFEHEERPQTAQVEQRVPTTSTQFSRHPTTTQSSRPEFTPTSHENQVTSQLSHTNKSTTAFNEDEEEENHTTNFPTPPPKLGFGERRTVHENPRPTTISSQFDAYNQDQVNTGRPRQNFYPAESINGRRFGQINSRTHQTTRRPSSDSNEYDGPRFQSSSDNQQRLPFHRKNDDQRRTTPQASRFQSNARASGQQNEYEQVEFAASQDRQNERAGSTKSNDFNGPIGSNERTTSFSRDNQRTHDNRRISPSANEYENGPTVHVSQDSRQGLMISSTPNGEDNVNHEFNIDNRNNRRPVQQSEYESQATFSPSQDSNQKQLVIDNEQARLVAKLLNIDRLSGYTLDADDAKAESVDRFENATIIQGPPSPFSNETDFTNATIGEIKEINEILTRPLNASDQPFEDKNLRQATIEIIKLLHDEPTGNQQKDTVKVGKKVRVIKLPPISSEDDSEEIVLVGERGNATIHRSRNSMFIHATSNAQKRRV